MSDHLSAADLVETLADDVEQTTGTLDLTPAQVAEQAGITTAGLLALVAGDRPPTHRETVRLLRWLGRVHG